MTTSYHEFEVLEKEFSDILTDIVDIFDTDRKFVEQIYKTHKEILNNIYNSIKPETSYWEETIALNLEYILSEPLNKMPEDREILKSLMKNLSDIHYKIKVLHEK